MVGWDDCIVDEEEQGLHIVEVIDIGSNMSNETIKILGAVNNE